MKKNSLLFLFLFLILINNLYSQCRSNLIWSDEFNGNALDTEKWNYQTGNGCSIGICNWGNNELQSYTSENKNIRVNNGILTIEAHRENVGGSSFTSARINTNQKFSKLYGRFEARMRMPKGAGTWPAFWMLPTDEFYGSWPTSGEIDIMEYRGDRPNIIDGTLHYGNMPNNQFDGTKHTRDGHDFSEDFHVYAIEWEPNEMRWYIDNIRFKTETREPNSLSPTPNSTVKWPFDKEFHLLLNFAIGGWFTGVTNANNVQLTKPTFEIDYVRVYEYTEDSWAEYHEPFNEKPLSIPGRINAEEFDNGCREGAYYDTDTPNKGGAFRGEKVDIEATDDIIGKYNIMAIEPGEWLKYTVEIAQSGFYNFSFRVSSNNANGRLRIELDDKDITGSIAIPNTSSFSAWTNEQISNVYLEPGVHVLKLFFIAGGFKINHIDISTAPFAADIINFKGISESGSIKLEWTTQKERYCEYFEVQRSENGSNWHKVGTVNGAGNSNTARNYSFNDSSPLVGNSYYRLKTVDYFNRERFIQPIEVKYSLEVGLVRVSTEYETTFSVSPGEKILNYEIYDLLGKSFNTQAREATPEKLIINHSGIQQGLYLVRISTNRKEYVHKVILGN